MFSARLQLAAGAVAVLVPTLIALARVYRRQLILQFTATGDIPGAGKPRKGGKLPGTAVICGASIGGLFSARVCSDHFERVVVVEPEAWVLSAAAREGPLTAGKRSVTGHNGTEFTTLAHKRSRVYQYLGNHVTQSFLVLLFRALFSDYDSKAKERGALIAPADFNVYSNGWSFLYPYAEYAARGEELPSSMFCTRRTLESLLRTLVYESCPKVEYIQGTVIDYKLSEDGKRVASVGVRTEEGTLNIACDMVVDCTGNTQAGLKLLSRAIPSAATELQQLRAQYDPQMYYSGFDVPLPPGFDKELEKLRIGTDKLPKDRVGQYFTWSTEPSRDKHTFFITRVETGLSIGAGGWASHTPFNYEEFRDYVKLLDGDLPVPEYVTKIMDLLEPVGDQGTVVELRVQSCSRIFYEKAGRILPSNFVALGDATMRLNPRFGEGVTKTSVGAATLDGALRAFAQGPAHKNFGRTFFKRLADRTEGLWEASKASDYGAKTTVPVKGETLADGEFNRWYTRHLVHAAARDPAIASAFWHYTMFLVPASFLTTPSIMLKVFWEAAFPSKPI